MNQESNVGCSTLSASKAPEPVVYKVGDTFVVSKYNYRDSFEKTENNISLTNRQFYEIEIKRVLTPKVSFEDIA